MPQLRRVISVVTVLVLAVIGSTSCSAVTDRMNRTGQSSGVAAVASSSLDDVTIQKGEDGVPGLSFPRPFAVEETKTRITDPGDGKDVRAGQRLTVDYIGVNATDGSVFDSSYDRGKSASFVLSNSASMIQGLVTGLTGVPVGSRVLIAIPPEDGYGVQGVPASNIGPTDTLLFVVDVLDAGDVLKKATGTTVKPKAGLPTVKRAKSGEPTITIPSGDPPASLVVQPLIKGKGPKVVSGRSITVHYKAVVWRGSRAYHSTWETKEPETFEIGNGRVLAGLESGLVDQTVGSQVLIVIPPDDGYGAEGKPDDDIQGTDTLVFVVDILDSV